MEADLDQENPYIFLPASISLILISVFVISFIPSAMDSMFVGSAKMAASPATSGMEEISEHKIGTPANIPSRIGIPNPSKRDRYNNPLEFDKMVFFLLH